jgi:hypothetical protein
MAGVLERIRWPQKKLVVGHSTTIPSKVELRVMELQAAKEILAEIFGVRNSEVEKMIQNRYEEACYAAKPSYEVAEEWPREFMLKE